MTQFEICRELARNIANKHGLQQELVCAVIEHESTWNTYAVRFERGFEAKYVKPALPDMPTTEELTAAMSFGLMQIMGLTAREFGFKGKFLTELCEPDMGIEFGCRKLSACAAHSAILGGDLRATLLAYNGGGDKTYPDAVLPLREKFLLPGQTLTA